MQRQKSIDSFFKIAPENPKSVDATIPMDTVKNLGAGREAGASTVTKRSPTANRNSITSSYAEMLKRRGRSQFELRFLSKGRKLPEVRVTDTPEEKVPRPALGRRNSSGKGNSERDADREDAIHCGSSPDGGHVGHRLQFDTNIDEKKSSLKQYITSSAPFTDIDASPDDIDSTTLGPETPAMRPVVPHLKRMRDECKLEDVLGSPLSDSCKRKISAQESTCEANIKREVAEGFANKFEWLNPSFIRDAQGRRPGDSLYDKRTLYMPANALKRMSATQRQYWSVKSQYMDVIIFFKVGKFYELYELDAEIGHKELDWKITLSGVGKCRQVGVSESGIDDAVQKLIAKGYKVGRMEQIETAEQAKARGGASAVIHRKLVHVLSPSTTTCGNNFEAVHLLALKEGDLGSDNCNPYVYGFAFVDFAALKVWVGSICDDASCSALGTLLMHVSPKEVVYENGGLSKTAQKALKRHASSGSTLLQMSSVPPGTDFIDAAEVQKLIQSEQYFSGSTNSWSSASDSISHQEIALSALGALLRNLSRLMLDDALRNGDISPYKLYRNSLRMDGQTLVNLEVFNNNADGDPSGTLYNYLDHCVTASGKRLLRSWICHPLQNVNEIEKRLNVVEEILNNPEISLLIEQYLKKISDLERLLGRVKAHIRSSSLLSLPFVGQKILKQQVRTFGSLVKGLRAGLDLMLVLQNIPGNSCILKNLDISMTTSFEELGVHLQQIEVAFDDDFPDYQDRDIRDADAETLAVLVGLFTERIVQWSEVINALSRIDVLRCFAITTVSSSGSMSKPVFLQRSSYTGFRNENEGPILRLKGLWHPYATTENGGTIVPNNIILGQDAAEDYPCALLLTGPNMGGKSTLLRATCLAVILSQLGCYVPCEMCVLSPVDIIFTRLGATDHIMSGESTFLIECAETASILKDSTQQSLVVLDELGRGTSTFDGYAIAYAVLRHMVEKVCCRLLFATHYHPLTKEFASHPHVTLQHMACAFEKKPGYASEYPSDDYPKRLIFLYKLASGACPESYGMEVALMAGVPKPVVQAAGSASQLMKSWVAKSFQLSEGRSEFSTLHENWLKSLLEVSGMEEHASDQDDVIDTLVCLWHEMKGCYRSCMEKH